MHFIRAIVVAAILVTAIPASAQESNPNPVRGGDVYQSRSLALGYAGYHGRFLYGRGGLGWPVARPGVVYIADDYVPEGRPLGLSPNAYRDTAYNNPSWTGWPYYAHGRDAEPPPPPTPKAESQGALIDGRARWRAGDFSGALASFKKAVAEDLSSGPPRLHMALALLATGDLKNADKALASALEIVRTPRELEALGFQEWFRNPKERAKFEDKLFPARDGSGSVSVALAQHLLGLKEKAVKTLDGVQGPAAAKLTEWMR